MSSSRAKTLFSEAALPIEELRDIKAGQLSAALEAVPPTALERTIDQLRCLSYHVGDASERGRIIGRFCYERAPLLQRQGNYPVSLDAWILAVRHLPSGSTESATALQELENGLENLARIDETRTLHVVALLKATAEPVSPLYTASVGFLLKHGEDTSEDTGAMLLNLAHGAEHFGAGVADAVMNRAERLSATDPYAAAQVFRTLLDHSGGLSPEQESRAIRALEPLSESPAVLREILRRDYGVDIAAEDSSTAPEKSVFIHPAAPGLH